MLRADNVICGTSTTGTGTLTLAACPSPPGGLDFYHWLLTEGIAAGKAVLAPYTITEYTDAAFATAKQTETGIGIVTMGSSIVTTTIARTTVQSTITNMNTSAPIFTNVLPSAITIGTAANVLVLIGSVSNAIIPTMPAFDGTWITPAGIASAPNVASAIPYNVGSDLDIYIPFLWVCPMVVKSVAFEVSSQTYDGISNVYARIYSVGSSGRPDKLLVNFGQVGPVGTAFATVYADIVGTASVGYFLKPGPYYLDLVCIFSGGNGNPAIFGGSGNLFLPVAGIDAVHAFQFGFGPFFYAKATGGTSTAPDPANLAGWQGFMAGNTIIPSFAFRAT